VVVSFFARAGQRGQTLPPAYLNFFPSWMYFGWFYEGFPRNEWQDSRLVRLRSSHAGPGWGEGVMMTRVLCTFSPAGRDRQLWRHADP
jgi:hypothetical protein